MAEVRKTGMFLPQFRVLMHWPVMLISLVVGDVGVSEPCAGIATKCLSRLVVPSTRIVVQRTQTMGSLFSAGMRMTII